MQEQNSIYHLINNKMEQEFFFASQLFTTHRIYEEVRNFPCTRHVGVVEDGKLEAYPNGA
jgi:hypothetical protein